MKHHELYVSKFIYGKYYRCTLKKRQDYWNPFGYMDAVLDGKPRQCIRSDRKRANFDFMSYMDMDMNYMWPWETVHWVKCTQDEYNKAWGLEDYAIGEKQ